MSFVDKRTREYRVEEGTVHTALWCSGTGTAESLLVPRSERTRFPSCRDIKRGHTLLWWTDGTEAPRRTSWEEVKDQWRMVGSCSHWRASCWPQISFLILFWSVFNSCHPISLHSQRICLHVVGHRNIFLVSFSGETQLPFSEESCKRNAYKGCAFVH